MAGEPSRRADTGWLELLCLALSLLELAIASWILQRKSCKRNAFNAKPNPPKPADGSIEEEEIIDLLRRL